ncbi:MAG: protease modulator HflC [Candidatus Omnitrophica bacterium]|nr:protease modulator HflC [Candidatus Omnitrophota bacterium]
MNKVFAPFMIIVLLAVLIVLVSSMYVVDETNQVVVTQFGEPIGKPIKAPGLHLKVPFIQQANYFDDRLLEWDGEPNRIPTEDKKYIWIDTTARWRVEDPLKFLQTVHDERGAQSRLDDILDGATRNVIAKQRLIEVVRDSNRILSLETSEEDKIMGRQFEKISEESGRDVITRKMLERAKEKVKEYGIDLVDIRIKRVNYDPKVRNKVFERMISERKRAAELLRAQGKGEQAQIEGKVEKELQRIQSEAYHTAQGLKGKADAEAIKIYAEAYSKDPEFYSFLKTLESYRETLGAQSTLVLTTDSEYLKYLKEISGE